MGRTLNHEPFNLYKGRMRPRGEGFGFVIEQQELEGDFPEVLMTMMEPA